MLFLSRYMMNKQIFSRKTASLISKQKIPGQIELFWPMNNNVNCLHIYLKLKYLVTLVKSKWYKKIRRLRLLYFWCISIRHILQKMCFYIFHIQLSFLAVDLINSKYFPFLFLQHQSISLRRYGREPFLFGLPVLVHLPTCFFHNTGHMELHINLLY